MGWYAATRAISARALVGQKVLNFLRPFKLLFLSVWVFFHEHSRFTGQKGKGEAISLTPHWRKTFLSKEFMGKLF